MESPDEYPFDKYLREARLAARGDNSSQPLEVLASEQRIITMADALLSWMRSEEMHDILNLESVDRFFTHTSNVNPGAGPDSPNLGKTKVWILDKLDPDANRFFFDLLRATWERRCWQQRYGLRATLDE
jgi:hypothetical protein